MSEWIPITERVPSNGEAVLVANRFWADFAGLLPGRYIQHVYITVWAEEGDHSSITHWMPKPKPPSIVTHIQD